MTLFDCASSCSCCSGERDGKRHAARREIESRNRDAQVPVNHPNYKSLPRAVSAVEVVNPANEASGDKNHCWIAKLAQASTGGVEQGLVGVIKRQDTARGGKISGAESALRKVSAETTFQSFEWR